MSVCQQCGHNNAKDAGPCLRCGQALGRAAKRTVLGMPAPGLSEPFIAPDPRHRTAAPEPAVGTAGRPPAKHTLLGLAAPVVTKPNAFATAAHPMSTVPTSQHASTALPSPEVGQTLMGGVAAPQDAAAKGLGPAVKSRNTQAGFADPAAVNKGSTAILHPGAVAGQATLLGVAAPNPPDPGHLPETELGVGLQAGTGPNAATAKTIIGLATKGPPPVHPNAPASAPHPADTSAGLPVSQRRHTPRLPIETEPTEQVELIPYRSQSKGGWILLGVALLLLVGASLFVLFWAPPKPLVGNVISNDKGEEMLELRCENCPDGTTVRAAGNEASFSRKRALITPKQPFKVGDNPIVVTLDRPGLGRDEELELLVPVQFRIRGDFNALSGDKPALGVLVEAKPGWAVFIDGQLVNLDNGVGHHALEVSRNLFGPASEVQNLVRTVKYAVTPPGGEPETGSVKLGIKIAPLIVEAPGPSTVIDKEHFMLAGHTGAGGTVTVAGKPITVDPEGRFAQLMSVESVGETTIFVRASLPEHAPRWMSLRVKRVQRLTQEAKRFSSVAIDSYDRYSTDIEGNKGLAVVVRGRVEEFRISGHRTIFVLDVKVGCPRSPCLARVIHGSKLRLKKGALVSAYGHVTRAVEGLVEDQQVPELHAEFVLP